MQVQDQDLQCLAGFTHITGLRLLPKLTATFLNFFYNTYCVHYDFHLCLKCSFPNLNCTFVAKMEQVVLKKVWVNFPRENQSGGGKGREGPG